MSRTSRAVVRWDHNGQLAAPTRRQTGARWKASCRSVTDREWDPRKNAGKAEEREVKVVEGVRKNVLLASLKGSQGVILAVMMNTVGPLTLSWCSRKNASFLHYFVVHIKPCQREFLGFIFFQLSVWRSGGLLRSGQWSGTKWAHKRADLCVCVCVLGSNCKDKGRQLPISLAGRIPCVRIIYSTFVALAA